MESGKFRYTLLVATLLGFGLAMQLTAAEGTKAPQQKTSWTLAGDLEESCSCDAACPCWFGNKPTMMNCSGTQVLFIKKGSYGNVPLDGLAMAQFVQSPDGKSMMESLGDWNFGYIYIDERATPEQRQALQAISSQVLPPVPPERVKIRYVPISRKIEGTEHTVTVGNYAVFSGHLVDGGGGGTVKIVNPPMADPMHAEYCQGTTTDLTYNDAAKWDFKNSNYMYTTFNVTSQDYDKFAAEVAQKTSKKE